MPDEDVCEVVSAQLDQVISDCRAAKADLSRCVELDDFKAVKDRLSAAKKVLGGAEGLVDVRAKGFARQLKLARLGGLLPGLEEVDGTG